MKELLTNKEKEELLELLEDDKIQEEAPNDVPEELSTDTDEVLPFIYKYNLKSGDSRVNFEIIRKLYTDFAKNPITKTRLKRTLNMFFDFKKDGTKTFIKLDTSALQIAEELYKQKSKKEVDVRHSAGKVKHFTLFIDEMELKAGDEYVPNYMFHEIYKLYNRNKGKKKVLSQVNFIKMASLYFPFKFVRTNVKWFGLEKGTVERFFTGEQIEEIKQKRERKKKRRRRKKKVTKTQSTGQDQKPQD